MYYITLKSPGQTRDQGSNQKPEKAILKPAKAI
jgi:hypothetical protein